MVYVEFYVLSFLIASKCECPALDFVVDLFNSTSIAVYLFFIVIIYYYLCNYLKTSAERYLFMLFSFVYI